MVVVVVVVAVVDVDVDDCATDTRRVITDHDQVHDHVHDYVNVRECQDRG